MKVAQTVPVLLGVALALIGAALPGVHGSARIDVRGPAELASAFPTLRGARLLPPPPPPRVPLPEPRRARPSLPAPDPPRPPEPFRPVLRPEVDAVRRRRAVMDEPPEPPVPVRTGVRRQPSSGAHGSGGGIARHRHHRGDPGHGPSQGRLQHLPQGRGLGGAGDAGPLQLDAHGAVGLHRQQLHVAAVPEQTRTERVEDALHASTQVGIFAHHDGGEIGASRRRLEPLAPTRGGR